ncbi:HD family phosphohydrolase [Tepiditoga spiralis]|uniref:HD family phosphohydrolase n=1 Tax=Tepiditoga spiralis TaxID=2108365 RepID=A0A7G1GAE0_9BACT|nr:HD domain-containing phosphohydrolase [Tepiditoga spiralis]BBE32077.1 HD family phosphohydrolase [Tepiditoga spiralis]
MKKIKIRNLKPGLILAENLTKDSIILLTQGTVVTEKDIERLKRYKVDELYIYDEDDFQKESNIKIEFKEIPPVIESKKYNAWNEQFDKVLDITKIQEDTSELNDMVEDIYSTFLEKDEIFLNLFHSIGDKALQSHSINTSIISSIISIHLKMPKIFSDQLLKLSLIHDMGYAFIDKRIVFDYEETQSKYVKSHLISGYKAFENLKKQLSKEVVNSIIAHHERYDGNGILMGLKGEKISPLIRIMQIGDAYDSLIEIKKTPYEAMSYLLKNSGKIFDPYYVSTFFSIAGLYPTGTKVLLNNNEVGVVMKKGKAAVFPIINLNGHIIETGPKSGVYIKEVIG